MTTLIISKNAITIRKKNQSIKSHIKEHEKNYWISEYMRIKPCKYDEAVQAYNEVFEK